MTFDEFKINYRNNFKVGLILSLALHLFLVLMILIVKPKKIEPDNNNNFNYGQIDLSLANISPLKASTGGSPEEGSSIKAAGVPVPVKDHLVPAETANKVSNKGGDSTKTTGGGGGGGFGIPARNTYVFNKADFLIAVDMEPEPFGGYEAINKRAVYPETARKNSIQGKVFVQAYINENGEVVFAEVLKGLGYGCDESAMNSVKSTRFKPGKQNGHAVKVQMSIPVSFKMSN